MAVNTLVPWVTKLLLENDRVKVYEFGLKPGERTEMHKHPGFVIYALNDALVRTTFKDGSARELRLRAGDAMFLEGQEHIAENIGDTEARSLLVELKK